MTRKRPLERHVVRWRRVDDPPGHVRVAERVLARHHDDRGRADARNQTVDTSEYDQACEDGVAVVLSAENEEVTDGAA